MDMFPKYGHPEEHKAPPQEMTSLLSRNELYSTLHALDVGSTTHVPKKKHREGIFQFYSTVSPSSLPAATFERLMDQKGLSLARSPGFYWNNRKNSKTKSQKTVAAATTKPIARKAKHPKGNLQPAVSPEQYLRALNTRWNVYARQVLGLDEKKTPPGDRVMCIIPQDTLELRGALVKTSWNDDSKGMVILGESKNAWRLVAMEDGHRQRIIPKHKACLTLMLPCEYGEDNDDISPVLIRLESSADSV